MRLPKEEAEELKRWAMDALQHAYYAEFSALVNNYIEASHGLSDNPEEVFRGRSDVYRRRLGLSRTCRLQIHAGEPGQEYGPGYTCLEDALADEKAKVVTLNFIVVFRRNSDGKWRYVG